MRTKSFKSYLFLSKSVAIALLLLCAMSFSCCTDKTDKQPAKKELIPVVEKSTDTFIAVFTDTILFQEVKDSVIIVEEKKPEILLNSEQYISTEIITYYPPIDSLVQVAYMSQVGVREATGKNDGKDVEKYLHSVGLPKGNAWCAAFVKWCFDQAGVKTTITAWSPTAHNRANIVMSQGVERKQPQPSDVFCIYFPNLKRIGHTGFIDKKFGHNSYQTVEGNTNNAGSREGDGVYVKIRPKSSIYSITRWIN